MSAQKNVTQNKEELEKLSFDPLANLSLLPSSISRDELIVTQGKDDGLTTLFAAFQPTNDMTLKVRLLVISQKTKSQNNTT